MSEKTIKEIIKQFYKEEYICGKPENLSNHEKIIVEILYYLRNIKKPLEYYMKNKIFPSPKGKKVTQQTKRTLWLPTPPDACDKPLFTELETDQERKYNPYAYYYHCKTKEHCIYLVKHRINHVLEFFLQKGILINIVQCIGRGDILTLIDYPVEWVKDFIFEVISGSKIDIDRNFLTNTNYYKGCL